MEVKAHALVHERSSAVYINEVFRFNDHLRLELGGRYDYFTFDVEDLIPGDSMHKNYSGSNYQSLFNPKFNLVYSPLSNLQLFFNAGRGFHSNDARSVVQQPAEHRLPRAPGAEAGVLLNAAKRCVLSAAAWIMDISNELVYVGDAGTTEDKGSSRRLGLDLSARVQLRSWLFADADLNLSKNRFTEGLYGKEAGTDYFIPLAPRLTSSGGLTMRFDWGFEGSLRYRYLADRPANETNTVIAKGYNVVDLSLAYKTGHVKLGMAIENLLNVEWNEAQFDTESRLKGERQAVSELHYTPGTPFFAKATIGYIF